VARLGDVRKGLKDRLATIAGLEPYATMPASPKTPAAAVIPRSRELLTMDGQWRYRFEVWLYVNPSDLNRAQTAIDEYLRTARRASRLPSRGTKRSVVLLSTPW
jgi:hypothetical protein